MPDFGKSDRSWWGGQVVKCVPERKESSDLRLQKPRERILIEALVLMAKGLKREIRRLEFNGTDSERLREIIITMCRGSLGISMQTEFGTAWQVNPTPTKLNTKQAQ